MSLWGSHESKAVNKVYPESPLITGSWVGEKLKGTQTTRVLNKGREGTYG